MRVLEPSLLIGLLALVILPLVSAHDPVATQESRYVASNAPASYWCDASDDGPLGNEPYCVPGYVLFGTDSSHGVGAVAFCLDASCESHIGDAFVAEVQDDLPGASPPLRIRIGSTTYFGCGTVSGVIESQPILTYVWVDIDSVHVDAGNGQACVGTTGTIRALY